MYNRHSTSFTEDSGNLYLTLGAIGLSLISYSEPKELEPILNRTNYEQTIDFSRAMDFDDELTNHAMMLAQTSLSDDWDNEDSANWESYL
jgi:hypothetical protein